MTAAPAGGTDLGGFAGGGGFGGGVASDGNGGGHHHCSNLRTRSRVTLTSRINTKNTTTIADA